MAEEQARIKRAQAQAEAAAQAEREAIRREAAQADAAFERLLSGPDTDRAVAVAWNSWVSSHSIDDAFKDRLRVDKAAMRLYTAAQITKTVPSKRKAIREALAYFDRLALADRKS